MICFRPLVLLVTFLTWGQLALAQEATNEDVLLTLSIAATEDAAAQEITWNRETLMALPATTYRTKTIWTEGSQEFTGVLLKTLLDQVGLSSRPVTAYAINDYFAMIPEEDITHSGALISYLRNGQPMSVRDKGPLWIIYPFDDNKEFVTQQHFTRSVWQLTRIEIEE